MSDDHKPLYFVGSSQDDISAMPDVVKRVLGFALRKAQEGGKHGKAKPLTGDPKFKGAGVLEVVERHDKDTYRAVYTVNFPEAVYVLHAFKKKSKKGVATPKSDVDATFRNWLRQARPALRTVQGGGGRAGDLADDRARRAQQLLDAERRASG